MAFFNNPNTDLEGVAADDAALGPRVGFQEAWKASWDAQERGSAMYGIENAMWTHDDDQYRSMKKAGIEDAPKLSPESIGFFASWMPGPAKDIDKYMDAARFYEDGGDSAQSAMLREYDEKIEELRERYPDLSLKSSRDMWDDVRTKAQEAELKQSSMRTTTAGGVASFLGGAVASMNPNTDPFNAGTAGVGGLGKTAALRIATQVGAQGVIETVNQVTGVQEERRLLGLHHGFGDAVSRIAMTAAGAGVLQGAGEGLVAGGKRFFRTTPKDTPPPPPARDMAPEGTPAYEPKITDEGLDVPAAPTKFETVMHQKSPYSTSRAGQARTRIDVDYVSSRLEAWDGEAPHIVPPRADTAMPKPVSDFHAADMTVAKAGRSVDDLARDIDPDVFRQYDKLADRKKTYQKWIEDAGDKRVNEAIDSIVKRMDDVEEILDNPRTPARKRKAATKEMDELNAKREETVNDAVKSDTPEMAKIRRELLDNDFKMRDLSPTVGRAYARAQERWDLDVADRNRLRSMVKQGRKSMPEKTGEALEGVEVESITDTRTRTLADKAPHMRRAGEFEGRIPEGADAADAQRIIIEDGMKVMDEARDNFRQQLDGLLEGKSKKIELPGIKRKLDLDKDTMAVPNEKGEGFKEITIREFLEEQRDADFELEATKICSIK